MDDSLATLGLIRDPSPAGKVIGTIHVVSQDVFSRRDWWFQLLNFFHRTTRPISLRRELLMRPGQRYDQALVEETIRNLQSPPALSFAGRPFVPPELSSVVDIEPVVSPLPGTVDLLVVTRDVWSLRFNTNFEFQQNTLSLLSTSLSENNLFGWRKYLAVNFLLDQGKWGTGPTYFDPDIRGTHLTLYAAAMAWYARETERYEGNEETLSLRYPLYSLASRWGAGVDFIHRDTVLRSFRGNVLRLQDVLLPSGATEPLPAIYRRRITTVDVNVVRSFGTLVVQRLTLGHLVDGHRSEVLADFPDPAAAGAFLDQFAPVSERRSEPYLRYDVFLARYGVLRDLDTFDLRESVRLGPSLSLLLGYGVPALGADFQALVMGGTASLAVGGGGGYGKTTLSASARLREGRLIDQIRGATSYAASPMLWRVVRLVMSASVNTVRADTARGRYLLGGSSGLRGYAIGEFQGTTEVIAHAELRFAPAAVFSQRLGALLFYDLGDAAASFAKLHPYHDVGLGLRWLIPQLNSTVLRFDWAFATASTELTRAGWPGRLTAGFQQVF